MTLITGAEARKILGRPWPIIPAVDDGTSKRCTRRWKHLQGVAASSEYDAEAAALWAAPTGAGTGFVALDFDGPEGLDTLARMGGAARAHVRTGSGGYHVYVEHPGHPIRNQVRALPGMDVRGDGGIVYVIGASLKGPYEILRPLVPYRIADLPAEAQRVLAPSEAKVAAAPPGVWAGAGNGKPGSVAFVEQECEKVRRAVPGTVNGVYVRAVYAVAGLVGAGAVDGAWARAMLESALGVKDHKKVLEYTWSAGMTAPWRVGPVEVRF